MIKPRPPKKASSGKMHEGVSDVASDAEDDRKKNKGKNLSHGCTDGGICQYTGVNW